MQRNITFSADENLIERARTIARSQNQTLNTVFREWLAGYAARRGGVQEYRTLMDRLSHVSTNGRKFTRGEMNER